MDWFKNLKTRTKLFIGFGLVIVLLGVVIGVAYVGITRISNSQQKLFERDFALVTNFLQLRADLNHQRADIQQMMLTPNRSEQERIEQDIRDRTANGQEIMQKLFDLSQDDPGLSRRLEQLDAMRTEYRQAREVQINQIQEGKVEEAKALSIGVQAQRYLKIRALETDLGDVATEHARNSLVRSEQEAQRAIRLFGIIGLVALGVGVGMTLLLSRTISTPLRGISIAAERIAQGDLTVTPSRDGRRDEVGLLEQNFGLMSDGLRQQIAELREGANTLGAAASEIVAATRQLATAAAESATAVSETTTTVEEVRQTAEVSSQKAKYVSDSAQKAVQTASSGRRSTDEMSAGMSRVREQMEAIAESMMRLSEQSQTIGQIIASVEDLATQSNLLAVNAAIEAAKAGEHGKGFGVVAQEVKSLAEQSRLATNQVRTILSDIQKATSAAVMVTEQGSKAVEAGERQTGSAAESIQVLAGNVSEAAQAATQIAASSQQQLVGMEQVASAMENIKQVSQQNVASAKQVETAARNIDDLGQRLKLLVERYKV